MVNLFHRKNEIAIDLSGVQNASGIEIYYNGKMYAESQLPDDWQLFSGKHKIVCFSLGNSIPELLLNYTGLISISGGSVIDKDLNKHGLNIIVEDIDYWYKTDSEFDKNTQYWEGLGSTHQKDKTIKYSSVVKNNLTSYDEEYYFEDGTLFQGEYHQHGDGQAMTGGVHTSESQPIYKKKADGQLFNPRKKMPKRQIMTLKKKVEKFIPSIRMKSKSYSNKQKIYNKAVQKISKESVVVKPAISTAQKASIATTPIKTKKSKIEKY